MKVLSKEKIKVLAERNGWSLTQAEGYVDGETFRRRGKEPSTYARIGIDEYCLGFRAGYYERRNNGSEESVAGPQGLRQPVLTTRDAPEPAEVSMLSAQSG